MVKNISTDRLIGLSAMLISVLSLMIFIYQTNVIRKQSRLSVQPRLGFTFHSKAQDSVMVITSEVKNKGIGPAIIESVVFEKGGKEYNMGIREFMNEVFPDIHNYGRLEFTTKLHRGTTLSPNEEIVLYIYHANFRTIKDLLTHLDFDGNLDPFKMKIVYSSIYGDQWVVDNDRGDHPKKL